MRTATGGKRTDLTPYAVVCLSLLAALLVMSAFTGIWPWSRNAYNSFSRQAAAWLEGRLDLGKDYPWLELAIYDGKYFVSFPPFPSVVMLPFTAVFGAETPDVLISWIVTLLGGAFAVRLGMKAGLSGRDAAFWALFLHLGTGYMFIAQSGWVWFFAQTMNFTLLMGALMLAQEGKGGGALTLWACAVGCRPFSILYLPVLVYLLYRAARPARAGSWVLRRLYWAVGPCLIAGFYMTLNAARFGNVLEFGHTWLPEFQRAEHGQFSLTYFAHNFALLFRLPETDAETGRLIFAHIDTMLFPMICPLTVTLFLVFGHECFRGKRQEKFLLASLPVLALLHLVLTCCHRTMGGVQFGNRYLVDLLPPLYLGLCLWMPKGERFRQWQIPLFIFGLVLNTLGTYTTYL